MPKFDRFDLTVWSVLAGLGLALLGVIWLGDRAGARVLDTSPAEGALAGGYARIGVSFGQPMQVQTVEPLFSLDPPLPGRFVWQGQQMWFVPSEPLQPGLTYTARLRAGALSQGEQEVKQDLAWQFSARAPEIVYVSPASQDRELWRHPLDGSGPQRLTTTSGGLFDFAVSPDGEHIVYSALNDEMGLSLWIISRAGGEARLLAGCGRDRCSVPAWSPDGARLAYSRESAGVSPDAPNGPPRVWTLDLATGQTAPLYQDSQVLGYGPSWSPDGRRLAAFDGGASSIRVLDLQTSREMLLPSQMGTIGAWSPDGGQMLFNDLSFGGDQPFVTVYLADFATDSIQPVLGRERNFADYGPPAWSPSGDRLVISQRPPEGGAAKQLWQMRPDGTEARAITADPQYTHGGYHWDPWGQALVFQRFEIGTPFAAPAVLVWTVATDQIRPLAEDATTAAWLP